MLFTKFARFEMSSTNFFFSVLIFLSQGPQWHEWPFEIGRQVSKALFIFSLHSFPSALQFGRFLLTCVWISDYFFLSSSSYYWNVPMFYLSVLKFPFGSIVCWACLFFHALQEYLSLPHGGDDIAALKTDNSTGLATKFVWFFPHDGSSSA